MHEIAAWGLLWERQRFNSAVSFLADVQIQSKAPMKLLGIYFYTLPRRKAGLLPCLSTATVLLKS